MSLRTRGMEVGASHWTNSRLTTQRKAWISSETWGRTLKPLAGYAISTCRRKTWSSKKDGKMECSFSMWPGDILGAQKRNGKPEIYHKFGLLFCNAVHFNI